MENKWNNDQVWKQLADDRMQRHLADVKVTRALREAGLPENGALKARAGHLLHEFGEQLVALGYRLEGPDAHELTFHKELS